MREGREGRNPNKVEGGLWTSHSTVPEVCASRTYRTDTTVSIVYIGNPVPVVQVVQVVPVVLYICTLGKVPIKKKKKKEHRLIIL